MDIKAKVEELVDEIRKNPKMLKEFKENPVPVIEKLVGMDLPDDQILKLVELVKAKLDLDKVGSLLGGLFGVDMGIDLEGDLDRGMPHEVRDGLDIRPFEDQI